jgi:flagellar biosynthesis protein
MKRKKAAALKYDKKYNVPVVTAVGFGQIAERIIKTANENYIPIVENSDLAESLSKLPLSQSIPSELYEVVAEIIAFIYKLNDEKSI